jgi:hypothetical protein
LIPLVGFLAPKNDPVLDYSPTMPISRSFTSIKYCFVIAISTFQNEMKQAQYRSIPWL